MTNDAVEMGAAERAMKRQTSLGMPASIAKALVLAQKNVKPVEKAATNEFAKYKYATMDSLADECRRAMTSAGLALAVVGARPFTHEGQPRLMVDALLVHDSGEAWSMADYSIPVVQSTSKNGNKTPVDKAEAAALTYARGYLALCLLQIAREDEHAVDQRDDSPKRPAKSTADVAAMCSAFDACQDKAKLAKLIDRASEVDMAGELSEADYVLVGKAIAMAEKRVGA